MRLKILIRPAGTIDGVCLDQFQVGEIYELRTEMACVFLIEEWAEIVSDSGAAVFGRAPRRSARKIDHLVLVVEDEPDQRHLTACVLTSHGYQVMVAAHGLEAIDRLRESCPDLIVLDLNMPVMDGWQFRTEQRRLANKALADVPVVLLTGVDDAARQRDALRAAGVVRKPFDPDDLLDAVSAALGPRAAAPHALTARAGRTLS